MKVKNFVRLSVLAAVLSAVAAAPARAQFTPRSPEDLATGEQFHVEGGFGFWMPSTDMSISSEALGIQGTDIDFKKDLGLEDHTFHEFHLVLRPARKHKFRFEYTPISYEAQGTLQRDIIFNGQRYTLALPVATDLEWKAYRFIYEFDFVSRDRGFVGLLLEAKYTDVRAELSNILVSEFVSARAPIPTIGVIGRGYVAPNISITGELSGLGTGGIFGEDYRAHYLDFDLYGTVNFTNNFGAQVGYRTFNVFYHVKRDEGDLVLKGLYFGGVARF